MAVSVDELIPFDERFPTEQTPIWEFEGFDNRIEYEDKFVKLVDSLLTASKRKYEPIKMRWSQNEKRVEMDASGSRPSLVSIGRSDLPMVPQAVEEAVALAVESLPRAMVAPKQSAQEAFAGALNYFMEEEYQANDFDLVVARACWDSKLYSVGFIKQTVDMDETGPLGQPGRIVFSNVDPRHVWADPFAKSWRWADQRYLIVAEPMDLSEIRARYPGPGLEVEPEANYSDLMNDQGEFTGFRQGQYVGDDYTIGERHRAMVIECWLKDDRKIWEPKRDPDTDEILRGPDGAPLGRWVKKYPGGRLIVVANGVLLRDQANPFRHKQPPYTVIQSRISRRLFGYGDVELIGLIEDKINQLHKDAIRNLRVNMNSPWVMDHNAFDNPDKFHMLTNEPGMVLPVTPGARIERLMAGDLPVSLFNFVDWMKGQFDDLLGVQPVLRGQLEKGSQLSADAVEKLQVSSTARVRLKSRLLENALKHAGHLLQWNIRQFYPDSMTVESIDPRSGAKNLIYWNADAAQADYSVNVEAGSALPGSKQSKQEAVRQLFKDGICDREYAIRNMDLQGADALIERMNKREEFLARLGMFANMTRKKKRAA